MKTFREFLIEAKERINHKLVDMKILNEMSTVCPKRLGYGFILQIYSDDHEPAHMHMSDLIGNEITRILLTDKIPTKITDINEYPKDHKINNDQKRLILKWAKGKSKLGFNNWLYSMEILNTYQED